MPMDITGKSKLKAYKGTTLISVSELILLTCYFLNNWIFEQLEIQNKNSIPKEQSLPGIPSAVESFYVDEHEPRIPGNHLVYVE